MLTQDQVERYWQQGFLVGIPILTEAQTADLRARFEAAEAERLTHGPWVARDFRPWVDRDHPLRDWFRELARLPALLDAVEAVLGPDLLIRNGDLFVKEPGERYGVDWHLDAAVRDGTEDGMLSAWIGLGEDPVDARSGGVVFAPGGHRLDLPDPPRDRAHLNLSPQAREAIARLGVVQTEMPPGHLSLHHARTPHASWFNTAPHRRIGFVLRFLRPDVSVAMAEASEAVLVRGRNATGRFTLRDDFPVSWARGGPPMGSDAPAKPPAPTRPPDPAWMAHRDRLHARFAELQPLRDASQLAFLRGPEVTFTEEQVRGWWREVAAAPQPGRIAPWNHVYVHVPFCKSICTFCNYERLKPSNPRLLEGWLARVLASVEAIGPAVAPLTFHSLYIGGGTPSTLPAPMLDTLLSALFGSLHFDPDGARHIELDPAVLSDTRLDVLQKHGFRRFSFGIQSLDGRVNEAHDRGPQTREVVARCFEALKARGVHRVSCDLLMGLAGTTPEQVLGDLDEILGQHRPMAVDLFALVPTDRYLEASFGGSAEAFWRHMAAFEARVPAGLPAVAARHGYNLREEAGHRYSLWRVVEAEEAERSRYSQLVSDQQRPLNLLGFGTSARSAIFQRAEVQYRDPGDDPGAPGAARYVGHRLDTRGSERTYLVFQLRDRGEVERAAFEAIFGRGLDDVLGPALPALIARGLVVDHGDRIELVPTTNLDRAQALLWLVRDEDLEYELARAIAFDLSPEGVAALLADLPRGTAIGPGWTYQGVERGRAVLAHGGVRVPIRFVPPVSDGGPLGAVAEAEPPVGAAEGLGTAVRRLRTLAGRELARRGRGAVTGR